MATELEWKLCRALEHIEAILNRRPNAFVNEDAETKKIRGIIEAALKELTAAKAREYWQLFLGQKIFRNIDRRFLYLS